MPTLAGVYAFRSTNAGTSWDTSCITPNWWRWGIDICPLTAQQAWGMVQREDTIELYATADGGATWRYVEPKSVQLDRVMSVHFYSVNVGVVIGQAGRRIENRWYASRTTDGGQTWTRSVPMIVDPVSERIALPNDRSTCSIGGICWIGMSSGRIMTSNDSGRTWRIDRTTLSGGIGGLCILNSGALAAFGKEGALTTTNGKEWQPLSVAIPSASIHGIRKLRDGSLALMPDPNTNTNFQLLSADATSIGTWHQALDISECYSIFELENGMLLLGTELVPGKGVLLVKRTT